MSTQVYYRKWRPASFSQLVGQEHVSTTLRQSTKLGRVSHSYLFCGPRGSGKTTTARIVAKAVNCLDLREGDPCNACSICRTINDGRFLDIIELDAASNRGIDEIRDIREKVNFSPAQGRRKVYIIDEAHMLTEAASNAFLKTLEEPPGHVIFILCTTEAHKILPTIVSRCQRFDFRRIPSNLVYQRLGEIARAEGITVGPEALRLVARYAAGSLRDAENLLEQLVVAYSEGFGIPQVEELLGLGHGERWLELVKYLLLGNASASLGVINQAAWDGTDLRQLHRQTLELLRAALLLQWAPGGHNPSVDLPEQAMAEVQELVGKLPGWRIVRALKLWGEVNLRYDAPSTLPLELAAVEICDSQVSAPSGAVEPSRSAPLHASPPPTTVATVPSAARRPPSGAAMGAEPRRQPPARTPSPPEPSPEATPVATGPTAPSNPLEAGGEFAANWTTTVRALARHKGKKYNLGALLRDCRADHVTLEGDTLVLAFTHRALLEMMQEELEDPNSHRLVSEIVSKNFGGSYKLRLILLDAKGESGNNSAALAQNSPLVRVALGMGARIIDEVVE